MDKIQIDFKFAKNWRAFMNWYDKYYAKTRFAPMWEVQAQKIQACFEPSNPGIINWKQLWKDLLTWNKDTMVKKGDVRWSEQKRQIETLMLNQLAELNKEQFILVFLHRGKPETDGQKMTYWEALRTKENLDGDSNGNGGDENLEKITIVNLKNLLMEK